MELATRSNQNNLSARVKIGETVGQFVRIIAREIAKDPATVVKKSTRKAMARTLFEIANSPPDSIPIDDILRIKIDAADAIGAMSNLEEGGQLRRLADALFVQVAEWPLADSSNAYLYAIKFLAAAKYAKATGSEELLLLLRRAAPLHESVGTAEKVVTKSLHGVVSDLAELGNTLSDVSMLYFADAVKSTVGLTNKVAIRFGSSHEIAEKRRAYWLVARGVELGYNWTHKIHDSELNDLTQEAVKSAAQIANQLGIFGMELTLRLSSAFLALERLQGKINQGRQTENDFEIAARGVGALYSNRIVGDSGPAKAAVRIILRFVESQRICALGLAAKPDLMDGLDADLVMMEKSGDLNKWQKRVVLSIAAGVRANVEKFAQRGYEGAAMRPEAARTSVPGMVIE